MDFKLQDFVDTPSIEKIRSCTKENVFAIAEYYDLEVGKHAKKEVLVQDVCVQLIAKGILPAVKVVIGQAPQPVGESVRLKELEVELQRLAIRDKELQLANELEMKKLELWMRELELGAAGKSTEFDVAKYIRLVPPFNEGDVDKYFVLFE